MSAQKQKQPFADQNQAESAGAEGPSPPIPDFNYFWDQKRYGKYYLEQCFPVVEVLKKNFLFDHLQTNFSAQKKFVEILGNHKFNMDSRLNSFDFETNFPKIVSKMIILQKFLSKDIKSFKFLMRLAEFRIHSLKSLQRNLARRTGDALLSLMRHHREVYLSFLKTFESMEKCEKLLDRTLKRVRNYDLARPARPLERVHVAELEQVLVKSLDFGFLFASKVFDINDSVKAFYQFLGLKKDLLMRLFQLDFLSGVKLLQSKHKIIRKESPVYNEDSSVIDRILGHLGSLQKTDSGSIPQFIESVEQTIRNLLDEPVREGLGFLSKP